MHKHHPHHKSEMEHHKMRSKYHHKHMAEKHKDYAKHAGHHSHNAEMSDNRHVYDSHQEGISRVIMKPGQLEVNQHGSMAGGWRHGEHGMSHQGKINAQHGISSKEKF